MRNNIVLKYFHRGLALSLFVAAVVRGGVAQVPSIVLSNHISVYASLTKGVSRVSANARGDVFFADPGGTRIVEVAAGTTTPISLLTGIKVGSTGSAPDGVSVDSAGNVYVADAYDGRVIRIPFVNGSYPTSISVSTLDSAAASPTVCTAGLQVDCTLPTTTSALIGYYMQASDVTIDGAGNFYFVDISDGISGGAYNRIIELTASGTVQVVADHLTSVASAQIASDAAGDLYYAMGQGTGGATLFSIQAGASSLTAVASGLKSPTGVTFDQGGNLIVSDSGNSRIVVVPLLSGSLSFAELYVLTPQYSQNSVGVDSFGTVYYTGTSSGATSVNASHTSVYSSGLLAVQNAGATYTLQASFNTSATFSKIVTQSLGATVTASLGTCVAGTTYTATQSCSLNMQITPTKIGPVSGTLGVQTSTGAVLGGFALSAIGQGAQVTVDPGVSTALGSGFKNPSGVAVDGAGNIFVADTAANTVYELAGGSGSPVAVGSGLSGPTGVAVDASGDLFIADTGNNRVVELPNLGGAFPSASQKAIASGLTAPLAVATGPSDVLYVAEAGKLARYDVRGLPTQLAKVVSTAFARPEAITVDANGDLFVADATSGDVSEIANYTGVVTTVASGLTLPSGLVSDPAGDLFIVDNGTAQLVRVPVVNGSLAYANAVSAGSFASPVGLGIDSAGNLYVSDASVAGLFEVKRSSGLLNFGNVNIGATSPSLSATVVSTGNATSITPTFGNPAYAATGDLKDFSIASGSTCVSGATLAPTGSCVFTASFHPLTTGSVSQALTINFTNLPPLALTLTGAGRFLAGTTTVVALTSPTGGSTYGQTATLTATVTPSALNNNALPSGTVTFTINGVAQKPVALGSNGVASIQTASLAGGANTITASYSGDVNYQASSAPTITLNVAQASTTTNLTLTTVYSNPASTLTGSSMTFTAVVTPSVAGQLDGSVSFDSGSTVLGTAMLTATTSGTYQAVLTTSTVPSGTYIVTAVYPGDANYSGSSSAGQGLIVSSAGIQMTTSSTALTSTPSVPGSITLSVASVSGLTAPVTFACSGLPTWAVCHFNPSYISLTSSTPGTPVAPTQVVLSINVDVNPGQSLPTVSRWRRMSDGTALALVLGIPWFVFGKRRRLLAERGRFAVFALLLLPICLGAIGCGSSATFITPSGTVPVVVTATSSTATTSITLNLTVAQS